MKSILFTAFILAAVVASAQQAGPDISTQFPSTATTAELDRWVGSINNRDGVILMNRTAAEKSSEVHESFTMTKQSFGFIVGQYSYQFAIDVDVVNGVATVGLKLNRPTVIGIVLDSDIKDLFVKLSDSLKSTIGQKEAQQ